MDTPPNTLSLGERMRCEIVASLIHRPSILLADEPTIGLDVVGKTRFRNLLKQWQEEEKSTLLLTSHDIGDVEALCERAILINKGKSCYNGSIEGLKGNSSSTRNVKLTFSKPIQNGYQFSKGIQEIENNHFTKKFQINIDQLSITSAIDQFLGAFRENILDISVEAISLESIITQWYTRE